MFIKKSKYDRIVNNLQTVWKGYNSLLKDYDNLEKQSQISEKTIEEISSEKDKLMNERDI